MRDTVRREKHVVGIDAASHATGRPLSALWWKVWSSLALWARLARKQTRVGIRAAIVGSWIRVCRTRCAWWDRDSVGHVKVNVASTSHVVVDASRVVLTTTVHAAPVGGTLTAKRLGSCRCPCWCGCWRCWRICGCCGGNVCWLGCRCISWLSRRIACG